MDDMKKLDVKAPVEIGNIEDLKSKAYDRIMADPIIRKYLKETGLPLSFVNDNLGLFLRMEEENRPCAKCKSFKDCKKEQNTKGYLAFVDPFESITYRPCKNYREFLKISESYVYRDFSDDKVFLNFKDLKVVDYASINLLQQISNAMDTKRSIYISSKDSLGLVSKYLIANINAALKNKGKVAYINAPTLQSKVDEYNRFNKDELYKFSEMIKTCDILVINGMGNENTSYNLDYYKYTYLMDLFNYREQNGLLTFVTSYYTFSELKEVFGGNNFNLKSKTELLMKKIKEHCDEKVFNSLLK